MHNTLTYSFLGGALILYLYACKILIDDARAGFYVTMGGEMYFSQIWTFAAILTAVGVVRLFTINGWFGIPIVIICYIISIPVRRAIKFLFLGLDLGKKDSETKDKVDQVENNET